jgi:UDP-glucose 4-epimerase
VISGRPLVGLTGATGFLGTAVTRACQARALDVVALGREGTRPWRAEWTTEQMTSSLVGLDILIHAAARVPHDMKDASEAEACYRVNALGTLALAQACRAAGVRRFLLVSTANFVERRPAPVEDDAMPAVPPLWAPYYLTSKLVAETYVSTVLNGREALILRPSSIYGPGMSTGIVPLLLNRLRTGQPIVLQDGGRHSADYVYVDDVAGLVVDAALSGLVGHLNAGSGVASDLNDLVRAANAAVSDSSSAVTGEQPDLSRPPTGFSALNLTRARATFGYRPRSLKEGMRDMLAEMAA